MVKIIDLFNYNNIKLLKKNYLTLTLTLLISIVAFSQEKKLLLRFNEISESEINSENNKYNEKGITKNLGTILIYSKTVMIYNEQNKNVENYEITKIEEEESTGRKFYYSETGKNSYIFALTKEKTYLTSIGRKKRLIYSIIDYKYVNE